MASRLLLPCTSGVDSQAITYAVQLARSQNAVLVPLALVQYKAGRTPNDARLEHIQRSKDFLEMTRTIAARFNVTVECYECYTSDVVSSMIQTCSELACVSEIVVMSKQKTYLIQADEVKALLQQPDISLMILQAPEHSQRRRSVLLEHVLKGWQHQNEREASELMTSH